MKIRIVHLILLSFMLVQCKRESELKDELQAGFEAAKLLQRAVSISAVMDDFESGKPDNFFGLGATVMKIDSNPANPDYHYVINLGNGVLCKDGLYRKGRISIHFIDTQGTYYLHASSKDSFALQTSSGWEYLLVDYKRQPESASSFNDEFDIYSLSEYGVKMENGFIQYKYSIQPFKSLAQCEREFSINSTMTWLNQSYQVSGNNLFYSPGCLSNIIAGYARVSKEAEILNVEFDPFSNKACDDVVKVYNDKKFQKTELTGSTW